ncbi:unnamed protein product [Amoebophrya sp. A25]|nr:unnamed protein product [Amoebophrya sp. A25]|eukprot:GSA25T00018359001.1
MLYNVGAWQSKRTWGGPHVGGGPSNGHPPRSNAHQPHQSAIRENQWLYDDSRNWMKAYATARSASLTGTRTTFRNAGATGGGGGAHYNMGSTHMGGSSSMTSLPQVMQSATARTRTTARGGQVHGGPAQNATYSNSNRFLVGNSSATSSTNPNFRYRNKSASMGSLTTASWAPGGEHDSMGETGYSEEGVHMSMNPGGGGMSNTIGAPGGFGVSSTGESMFQGAGSGIPGPHAVDEILDPLAATARTDQHQSVMTTTHFWLKQRKYQRKKDRIKQQLGGAAGNDSTVGEQVSVSRSFSDAGRHTSLHFSATDNVGPRHWELQPRAPTVSKATQRQIQMMAIRKAMDHDEAYQKEIKAKWKCDTDDYVQNQAKYDERLVSHVFEEVVADTIQGVSWRMNIPPQFNDSFMAPKAPLYKHPEPPSLRELVTYWWKKAGAVAAPALPPAPHKKSKNLLSAVEDGPARGEGKEKPASPTSTTPQRGGNTKNKESGEPRKSDPDKNLHVVYGEHIDTCGTSMGPEDCHRLLKIISDYNESQTGLQMSVIHKQRLRRSTFCRFLLDCEVVEIDGNAIVKDCAKTGKIGMLYVCNLFDSYVTYQPQAIANAQQRQVDRKLRLDRQAAREARKKIMKDLEDNPFGSMSANAAGNKAGDDQGSDENSAGERSAKGGNAAKASSISKELDQSTGTDAENRRYNISLPEIPCTTQAEMLSEATNHLGTISILEDFLPLMEKIFYTVPAVDFFAEYLDKAADRIARVCEQRDEFVQMLAAKFDSQGAPLTAALKMPIQRKFYPVQNLAHRVDPNIFNLAIRKLDEAAAMDVSEMVKFILAQNAQLVQLRQMFCEPEIWMWQWQWAQTFDELFDAFADFPTELLGWPEGHMSFGAFLRFAVDFRFFPQIMSYADLFSFYHSAECCIFKDFDGDLMSSDPELRHMTEMMISICNYEERKTVEEMADLRPVLGRAVKKSKLRRSESAESSPGKKSSPSKSRGSSPAKGPGSVAPSPSKPATAVFPPDGGNSVDDSLLTSSRIAPGTMDLEDNYKNSGSFLNYPLTASEIYGKKVNTATVTFQDTRLEQIQNMNGHFPGKNLTKTQEQQQVAAKEMDRDTFWTKSFEDMTKMEYETWHVLSALSNWLGNRGGDIKRLFSLFDVDGTGEVSAEEFHLGLRQTRLEPLPSVEVIMKMFNMMDEDASGELSVSELYRILKRFNEEMSKKRELEDPTVDLSTDRAHTFLKIEDYGFSPAAVKPIKMPPPPNVVESPQPKRGKNVNTYRIFGKRAFQESLLKMAFYHLNQNGNALQRNASTYVKALWLVAYIKCSFHLYYQKIDDVMEEATKQDEKLKKLLEKNIHETALMKEDMPQLPEESTNILFGEILGKEREKRRTAKLYDQSTAERLLKLQKLICATKTSYVSPVTRLLSQRWDPFASVEVVQRDKESMANRCDYCFEQPRRFNGGYGPNPSCVGCSPLFVDVRRKMTDLPLWQAIRPFNWRDEVRVTGEKRRYRIQVGKKRPEKMVMPDGRTVMVGG